jgi:hypothetical protein
LLTAAIALVVLWIVGLIFFKTAKMVIHLVLLVAIGLAIMHFMRA